MGDKQAKMKRCVIIAGGDCEIKTLQGFITKDDFVIAADSGYDYCLKSGVKPHLIIGDFDSFFGELPNDVEIIKLPVVKDDTDLLFAARCGIDKGFNDFVIFGGYGSRPDQNYAMYQTLFMLKSNSKNISCKAVCCGFDVELLYNESKSFTSDCRRYLSVFSFAGQAKGVTIKGADYEIENATLKPDFPVGVSNEINGTCTIEVEDGCLLVMMVNKNI